MSATSTGIPPAANVSEKREAVQDMAEQHKQVKPLIVMGMGRSGTRNFADILGAHAEVTLQGEIPHDAMSRFFDILTALDSSHGRDPARQRMWLEKKKDYILESFGYMAMGAKLENRGVTYYGHKTPRSERFFDKYEWHFQSVGCEPYYCYCARNPFDVWKSFQNMPWNPIQDVNSFIDIYCRSFELYQKAVDRAKGRVVFLNLDDYLASRNRQGYIENAILGPLGISGYDEFWERIASLENTNGSLLKFGTKPRELAKGDISAMLNHAAMRELIDCHFSGYL